MVCCGRALNAGAAEVGLVLLVRMSPGTAAVAVSTLRQPAATDVVPSPTAVPGGNSAGAVARAALRSGGWGRPVAVVAGLESAAAAHLACLAQPVPRAAGGFGSAATELLVFGWQTSGGGGG